MPAAQVNEVMDRWTTETGPNYSHPHIQMALMNLTDPSGPCIVVVDSMRLSSMTFLRASVSASASQQQWAWTDFSVGPCPIQTLKDFLDGVRSWVPSRLTSPRTIYKVMCSTQNIFSGVGTSHAVEILHRAKIHPLETVGTVWARYLDPLIDGLKQVFEFAHDKTYTTYISPAGNSGGSAFYEPLYITTKINQRWLKVYRQTKSHTLLDKAHYEDLYGRGWLDQQYQRWGSSREGNRVTRDTDTSRKRVQVYCISVPAIHAFVYTVIYRPQDFPNATYLIQAQARKKALGQGNPDIGPSSFFDTVLLEKSDKNLARRRQPLRLGKVGRPKRTKRLGEEKRLQSPVPGNRPRPRFVNQVYEDEESDEDPPPPPPPPNDDDDDDDDAGEAGGMSAVARGKQRAVSAPAPVPPEEEDEDDGDDDMRMDIRQDILGQGRNLTNEELEEEFDLEDNEDAESDEDVVYEP